MKLESIIVRELGLPLRSPFQTSFGKMSARRALLVEIHSEGLSGWGEIPASAGPFYSPETPDTAWHVLQSFIVPLVLGKTISRASDVVSIMEPIRGHEMAKGAIENALWDLEAQMRNISLHSLLGGELREISCGVSIGIHPQLEGLLSAIEKEIAAGYQRIKLKIKPGQDIKTVEAVRSRFPETKLMVDANSAYTLEQASHLKCLDAFGLLMIEQPLAWDDIYDHSLLQKQMNTAICLDESIHNYGHARAAIAMDACRVINIKLPRVGGYSQAKKIHDFCRGRSIPVWCGGMLESGVGRAHNIALSTLPGFVIPGDVSASKRYSDEDIIDPEVEVTPRGTIVIPTATGLGYTVNKRRVEKFSMRVQKW